MSTLLRVATPFVDVEIAGDEAGRAVLLSQLHWPIPRITLVPDDSSFVLEKTFPLLFEEHDYELLVQSRVPGQTVQVEHRDLRTIAGLRPVPNSQPSTVMGRIRFRQSVGLTTLVIRVGGNKLELTLEVFPAKLDYLDDYEALLSDVRNLDRTLPLRYFDETFRKAGTVAEAGGSDLEWLVILRSQVHDLNRALRYANSHPLMSTESHEVSVRPDRVRHVSSDIRRAASRGQGHGDWIADLPGVPLRSSLPIQRARDSMDSVEHRWLRNTLRLVSNTLSNVTAALRSQERDREARFGSHPKRGAPSAIAQQIDEVEGLARTAVALTKLPIVAYASDAAVPASFSSLRLLRTPGYSQAYQCLMALRHGLSQIGEDVDVSVSRLGALYEAWCFVEVVRLVEELTGAKVLSGLDDFIHHGALGSRLVAGKSAQAQFTLPDLRRLALRYNRAYVGLTGVQKPDIELVFSKDGWPDLIVIFDAKYRLDSSEESLAFYLVTPPPQDAISALHRYRDAIVTDHVEGGQYRPVVRGAALYPLSSSQSETYPASKLRQALDRYGIGAIPVLPGNTGHLRSWIEAMLLVPHARLAWPGPQGPLPLPAKSNAQSADQPKSESSKT